MKTPNAFNESDEAAKARKKRSIALGIGLALFVVIVFVVTLAKLQGHALDQHY
jgi:t-SNARE complex subunit (syntaxin)